MLSRPTAIQLGLLVTVLGLLYAGLQPFAFSPENRAGPGRSSTGLAFEAPSLAVSESRLVWQGDPAEAEISIHVELEPDARGSTRFGALFSLLDEDENPAFVIAQWRDGLNLRVRSQGDRGFWEIGARGVLEAGRRHLVTITSGPGSGTRVLIDGEIRAQSSRTAHVTAAHPLAGRILLGCRADGGGGWTGTIFGLGIEDEAMSPDAVAQLHAAARSEGLATLAGDPSLRALYLFDSIQDRRISDARHPSEAGAILVPAVFAPLRRAVLLFPSWNDLKKRWLRIDLPLNIFGFMPFGFLATLLLDRRASASRFAWRALGVVLLGAGLSLTIESIQIFLPDRSSSLLDLLANSLGTALGVGLASLVGRHRPAPES